MDSGKSINSFEIKTLRLALDFFDMGDFFKIFVISRNTEILMIEWNY